MDKQPREFFLHCHCNSVVSLRDTHTDRDIQRTAWRYFWAKPLRGSSNPTDVLACHRDIWRSGSRQELTSLLRCEGGIRVWQMSAPAQSHTQEEDVRHSVHVWCSPPSGAGSSKVTLSKQVRTATCAPPKTRRWAFNGWEEEAHAVGSESVQTSFYQICFMIRRVQILKSCTFLSNWWKFCMDYPRTDLSKSGSWSNFCWPLRWFLIFIF